MLAIIKENLILLTEFEYDFGCFIPKISPKIITAIITGKKNYAEPDSTWIFI